jgi:hypothetical protein
MMNSEEDCIPRSEGLTGLGVKNWIKLALTVGSISDFHFHTC